MQICCKFFADDKKKVQEIEEYDSPENNSNTLEEILKFSSKTYSTSKQDNPPFKRKNSIEIVSEGEWN